MTVKPLPEDIILLNKYSTFPVVLSPQLFCDCQVSSVFEIQYIVGVYGLLSCLLSLSGLLSILVYILLSCLFSELLYIPLSGLLTSLCSSLFSCQLFGFFIICRLLCCLVFCPVCWANKVVILSKKIIYPQLFF